jgi:AcrR family transcriptional regulator
VTISIKVKARRRRENQVRAARILAAAARVFVRNGVENATMEMIARESQVAVGTIYLHFASRDEVYLNLRAQFAEGLRARYREVKARGLAPIEELRALAQVYVEHLGESAEPVLTSEPTSSSEIRQRLRRASEIREFDRGLDLSRDVFHLFENTVRRAFEAGLITDPLGPTGVTVGIWAVLNGAYMVTRDQEFFQDITGLEPDGFTTKALESYLQGILSTKQAILSTKKDRSNRSTASKPKSPVIKLPVKRRATK